MDSLELLAIEGADEGARTALRGGGFVGRNAACRFRLSDPSVQPIHANIRRAPDHYVLTDVSEGAGIQVNGVPVKSRPLQAGDRIRIGAVVLEVVVAVAPQEKGPGLPMQSKMPAARRSVAGHPPETGGVTPGTLPAPEQVPGVAKEVPAPRTNAWMVTGVIAVLAAGVVFALWIHTLSMRGEVEKRCTAVMELAKSGRMTSWQALDKYREILPDAEEVHPQLAKRLKAEIRLIEADMATAQKRTTDALQALDAKVEELASRGDYAQAAELYRNADASLRKIVEDMRTVRIVELDRLAAEKATK